MKLILKIILVTSILTGMYFLVPGSQEYFRNTYDVFMAHVHRTAFRLHDETEEEIIEEKTEIISENYYYSTLNKTEKRLYKQILSCAEEMCEDFIPDVASEVDELNRAFEAVIYDQPQLFYLDSSYSYTYGSDHSVLRVKLAYLTFDEDLEEERKKFNEKCGEIILPALEMKSEYEKEKYVHDYLIEHVGYDLEADMNQSAYSAIMNGKTVCAGFSRAFQYLMKEMGMRCYYVTGTSEKMDHAWNIVLIDGEYYNVDVTWDNAAKKTDPYFFFNLTDQSFAATHTRSEASKDLPSCTSNQLAHIEDDGIWERVIFRIPF